MILLPQIKDKEQLSLGLMGGTFDPIHLGHLVTAEEARQQFDLDYVIFIPAGHPPHKTGLKVTNPEHRYLMTVLAVITNPYITVSRYEIDKEQPSYTIDTVKHFARIYGDKVRLFFITGADAILDIVTWKRYKEVLSCCSFIAASRPGYPLDRLHMMAEQVPEIKSHVHMMEIPLIAVSSTFIRERVASGKTIKYLTPDPVEQYIQKNRLYLPGEHLA